MPDMILHHYPESPFSEKIRLLMAYKRVPYHSVIIPIIMPKTDLMPLTGGYRKTPVLQIGADIYCDTELIARVIDFMSPIPAVFDEGSGSATFAQWTDQTLFKIAVAVAFQPKALANNPIFSDQEAAKAFAADRAELTKGSNELRMPLAIAHAHFLAHLKRLDNQLTDGRACLFGEDPLIADFSTYHCLWFIHNNEVLRDVFEPFRHLMKWFHRMAAIGPGEPHDMSSQEALAIARESEAEPADKIGGLDPDGLALGDYVSVMPIDYGRNPVEGQLVVSSVEEIAVKREDDLVGEVIVHFPRMGFEVRKLD